jgi:hypothetical protein
LIVRSPDNTGRQLGVRLTFPDALTRIFSAFVSLVTLLLIAGTSLADSYRVHYSIRGSGREITLQAESSAEARRTVIEMKGQHRIANVKNRSDQSELFIQSLSVKIHFF